MIQDRITDNCCVCILSIADMSRMTILSIYTDYLESHGIPYDIVCAKKYHENVAPGARRLYELNALKTANSSYLSKFLYFRRLRSLFSQAEADAGGRYSFVIVWNQITGLLFLDVLRRYRGRYCINVRDYLYDRAPIVRQFLAGIYRGSAFTTVSSKAFLSFMPKDDYLVLHSLNMRLLGGLERHPFRKDGEKIRILNIGQIRWLENIYPLVDALCDDGRFELQFVGKGADKVADYCFARGIDSVVCINELQPYETPRYLDGADIIFNLYGTGNIHVDTALSIKLYYAVWLGVPILVSPNTYMEKITTELGIGFSVSTDCDEALGNQLYTWYHGLDEAEIRTHCDDFIVEAKSSREELFLLLDKKLDIQRSVL